METKTIIESTIDCATDNLRFGYWDEQERWVELVYAAGGEAVASQKLQCSEELVLALVGTITAMKGRIGADLRSIWKRLDELDK